MKESENESGSTPMYNCTSLTEQFKCVMKAPDKVFMIRGNHETRSVNGWEGFYGAGSFIAQCKQRFGPSKVSISCCDTYTTVCTQRNERHNVASCHQTSVRFCGCLEATIWSRLPLLTIVCCITFWAWLQLHLGSDALPRMKLRFSSLAGRVDSDDDDGAGCCS